MQSITTNNISVNLKEAAQLAVACPEVRFYFVGEPGIGKSSLEKELGRLTGFATCFIDCANMDLGDAAVPIPVHDTKTLDYYINTRFGMHQDKPVVIILDEFTKAADPVKNMLHPLLESHKPRLGSVSLPKGSIVVMTGNLDSDGVGDSMQAHTMMRICIVEVRKPNHEEWLEWAVDNGINPIVMAWVHRNPECLASYRDDTQEGNPYIFFPDKVQGPVFTPRTAERASKIVDGRDRITHNAMMAALSGQVGAAAAASISAFIVYQNALPTYEDICADPTKAKLPDSEGAMALLTFSLLQKIRSVQDVTAVLAYLGRVDIEYQTLFNIHLARDKTRSKFAFGCKAFADWCAENQDVL